MSTLAKEKPQMTVNELVSSIRAEGCRFYQVGGVWKISQTPSGDLFKELQQRKEEVTRFLAEADGVSRLEQYRAQLAGLYCWLCEAKNRTSPHYQTAVEIYQRASDPDNWSDLQWCQDLDRFKALRIELPQAEALSPAGHRLADRVVIEIALDGPTGPEYAEPARDLILSLWAAEAVLFAGSCKLLIDAPKTLPGAFQARLEALSRMVSVELLWLEQSERVETYKAALNKHLKNWPWLQSLPSVKLRSGMVVKSPGAFAQYLQSLPNPDLGQLVEFVLWLEGIR